MSIPKHGREHKALGIPGAVAAEFDGVQPIINSGFFPAGHGSAAANLSSIATVFYLIPFVKVSGSSSLKNIRVYSENNIGTPANRIRYAIWNNIGVLLDDGISTQAALSVDGSKDINFIGGIPLPTDSFWFGFAPYEDGGTWEAIEFRAGNAVAYPGLRGAINDGELGTVPAKPMAIFITNPTDPIPALAAIDMVTSTLIPNLITCAADYE